MNNIRIDKEKCTFCGKCVDTCILDNLCLQVPPCQSACPLRLNVHGYVQLIARGKFRQALEEVAKLLPFPEIIGRICSRPCEKACARACVDEPLAIRHLKQFLCEAGNETAFTGPALETGRRVAIVGSGPAGMLAAFDLRTAGHSITMYEAAATPGGMLRHAIPDYRLPAQWVDAAFERLASIGIDLRTGDRVGGHISIESLIEAYDAVILALGTQKGLCLDIPGMDHPAVVSGLAFLRAAKRGGGVSIGRRVAVIGGGNTAIDSARCALRLGADEVRVVALEAIDEMPAFLSDREEALQEGVMFQNRTGLRGITTENAGLSLSLARCLSLFSADGVFSPCFDDADAGTLACDTVIVAIGQKPDFSGLGPLLEGGALRVDGLTLQTMHPKVFACGDVVTGASSAIEAMAQGREAACSVERLLAGEGMRWGRSFFDTSRERYTITDVSAQRQPRVVHGRHLRKRPVDFQPVDAPYTETQARAEAQRCLSCGVPYGKQQTCWYCLPCEIECPENALTVDLPYLVR